MDAIKTPKQYLLEYSLVVLGVLTAVGLENWRESRRHKELADQAQVAIQQELRDQLGEITRVLRANTENAKLVDGIYDHLLAKVRANAPREEWMPEAQAFFGHIQMMAPDFHRDAWDAALSSQAVLYLDPVRGRRYAAAYGRIRDVHDRYLNRQESLWESWSSTRVDAETGRLDPVVLLKVVRNYVALVEDFDAFLEGLTESLGKTLDAG